MEKGERYNSTLQSQKYISKGQRSKECEALLDAMSKIVADH